MSFEKPFLPIRKPKTAAGQSPSASLLKKAIAHNASAKGPLGDGKVTNSTSKVQLSINASLATTKKRPLKDLNSTAKPVPGLQLKNVTGAEASVQLASPPSSTRQHPTAPASTRARQIAHFQFSGMSSLNNSSRVSLNGSQTAPKQPSLRSALRSSEPAEASDPPEVVFPISPAQALKLFLSQMTDYEQGEVLEMQQIYFLGNSLKKKIHCSSALPNHGFDDERGDYRLTIGDHILYRYEILSILGKGSFGQVCKCFDHKHKEMVAVKVIRNKRRFHQQGVVEVKVLDLLRNKDEEDKMCVVKMKTYFLFRKHLCLSFELLSINLYDFLKNNDFRGLSLSLIRRFAVQLLIALKFAKMNGIIHCDLKPENVLLKQPTKSGIKVIDFGSACLESERVYTYIQSRFYRAPEIILGIPYTPCIDMWSLGCILSELYMGAPLLPGESEHEQLLCIMEFLGLPPSNIFQASTRKKLFFETNGAPRIIANSRGKKRFPESKTLQSSLKGADPNFVDFIRRCLNWDPDQRLTPEQALHHIWIQEGLTKMQQVLVN